MPIIRKNIAISDSGFVFDPMSGESFSLNPVGLEIVQLIKSGRSNEEIFQIMTAKYDIEEENFERYYYDFLVTLKQLNLTEPEIA
jgi:PqqD family protein of HPr-rel-A system